MTPGVIFMRKTWLRGKMLEQFCRPCIILVRQNELSRKERSMSNSVCFGVFAYTDLQNLCVIHANVYELFRNI